MTGGRGTAGGNDAANKSPMETGVAEETSAGAPVDMPKSGTGYPLMWPPPFHTTSMPPYPELLNDLKEGQVGALAPTPSSLVPCCTLR